MRRWEEAALKPSWDWPRRHWTLAVALLLAPALLALAACTRAAPEPTPTLEQVQPTATPTSGPSRPTPVLAALPSLADLVEQVRPAVVSVVVEQTQTDIFGRRFRDIGSGSGVIFREDGYVLTNNHVVEGATAVRVTLDNGRQLPAELVGADRLTDLAVIRVQERGLPAVPLGDASTLRIGDWVVAIGNALALEGGPSVTLGVVSALGRSIATGETTLFDLIQTDAAINPGNSGGPLLNLSGEVIGINTAREPAAQGIGFAISTQTAMPVAEQLVRNGRVIWPWLGVQVRELDAALGAELGVAASRGVLVTELVRRGPAEQAGILPDDVIVAMDGHDVKGLRDLQRLLRTTFKVGEQVKVKVVRGTQQREFQVTLGEFPR
ncbi:MAG: trypsin-like peptidase domain-containing protein [Chloroflexi bacterium]|nr:trypsin-like peptidase domain-containing protein [Chloroflexota bacterium]